MSIALPSSTTVAPAERSQTPARKSAFDAFLIAIGAIFLIGTEIWLAAIAVVWALHGLFATGMTGDIFLVLLVAPPAIWATWKTVTLAVSAERDTHDDI